MSMFNHTTLCPYRVTHSITKCGHIFLFFLCLTLLSTSKCNSSSQKNSTKSNNLFFYLDEDRDIEFHYAEEGKGDASVPNVISVTLHPWERRYRGLIQLIKDGGFDLIDDNSWAPVRYGVTEPKAGNIHVLVQDKQDGRNVITVYRAGFVGVQKIGRASCRERV